MQNNIQAATIARDTGIANAEGGAEALKSHRAYEALRRVAESRQTFIIDDVQEEWNESFTEGRAMGAVMTRGVAAGLIAATDQWRPSARKNCHRNPRRVWRSLVFGGAQ